MAIRQNIRTGLRWATLYACVYSAIVIVIALLRRATTLDQAGTSILAVLGVYWVGGLTAGLLVGVLLPIGRTTIGATVIGAVAGIPIACAATLVVTPSDQWGENLPVGVGLGILFGAVFGLATKAEIRG